MQTRYGKYELLRPLGSGASGTVYAALDTFAGKEVALKVFDRKTMQDTQMGELTRGQFMSEASLAGRLLHPHIVAIYEAVMHEDGGYVAMEYVAGGNLLRYTRPEGLLPVPDVIQIGFKSCSALDYAFRQGIIHRDIKPANILVSEGTNIKVADFGSALVRKHETREQAAVVGTPSYMSPEQIRGMDLTQYSDMYAMGVVLYELLTGRRPFLGSSIEELARKIVYEQPQPTSMLRREVPSKLDEIVMRMISKRPEERYPSWADLALDLAQIGKLSVYQREVADSEKFDFMCRSQIFGQLNDAHLWELVHCSRWMRVPQRTVILREGETGQSMYLLGAGQLKVTKKGRLLNLLNAGEVFGEMAYITGAAATRAATVETLTDSFIAEFDPSGIERLSEGCRLQIAYGLMRTLVERLAMANARIAGG